MHEANELGKRGEEEERVIKQHWARGREGGRQRGKENCTGDGKEKGRENECTHTRTRRYKAERCSIRVSVCACVRAHALLYCPFTILQKRDTEREEFEKKEGDVGKGEGTRRPLARTQPFRRYSCSPPPLRSLEDGGRGAKSEREKT